MFLLLDSEGQGPWLGPCLPDFMQVTQRGCVFEFVATAPLLALVSLIWYLMPLITPFVRN